MHVVPEFPMYHLWAQALGPSHVYLPSLSITYVLDCCSPVSSWCNWSLSCRPFPPQTDYGDYQVPTAGLFTCGAGCSSYTSPSLPASVGSCCQRTDAQSTSSLTWGEQIWLVLLGSLGSALEIGHCNLSLPVTYTLRESYRNLWVGAICQLDICFLIEVLISDRTEGIKNEPQESKIRKHNCVVV